MVSNVTLSGMAMSLILALLIIHNIYRTIKIELKNADDIQIVQSPGYPDYLLPYSSITWKMQAPPGFILDLHCSEVTVNPAKGTLMLWDGYSRNDLGQSKFKRSLSEQRYLELKLTTGWSRDRINCTVRPVPKEEPDSRELGFGPQQRDVSCPCGWTNKGGKKRMVGGRDAEPNEFVFMGYTSIYSRKRGNFFTYCSASILTKRHILTAAHCLIDFPEKDHEVVVGGKPRRWGENSHIQKLTINEKHVYKGYKINTTIHDIAIIELTEDIKFRENVGPVCLPSESYSLTNRTVKAVGWGQYSTEGPAFRTLKTVDLHGMDTEACKRKYPDLPGIEANLCFSNIGATCYGDCGGAFVYEDEEINRYVQVAVNVQASSPCEPYSTSLGLNLFFYLDWIKGVIANNSSDIHICQKV